MFQSGQRTRSRLWPLVRGAERQIRGAVYCGIAKRRIITTSLAFKSAPHLLHYTDCVKSTVCHIVQRRVYGRIHPRIHFHRVLRPERPPPHRGAPNAVVLPSRVDFVAPYWHRRRSKGFVLTARLLWPRRSSKLRHQHQRDRRAAFDVTAKAASCSRFSSSLDLWSASSPLLLSAIDACLLCVGPRPTLPGSGVCAFQRAVLR